MSDLPARKRVVWAHDRDYQKHPFIVLALDTLRARGDDIAVVAASKAPEQPFPVFDDFSFADRDANWQAAPAREQPTKDQEIKANLAARSLRARIEQDGLRGVPRRLARARIWFHERMAALHLWRRQRQRRRNEIRRDTLDTLIPYLRGFRRLRSTPADVVVASRPQVALWAALAAKLGGRRFVYYPFELYGDQVDKPRWFVTLAERLVLRFFADAVVTQNGCRAKIYREERGARVEPLIVHNYKPRPSRAVIGGRLRSVLGIPPERRIVLYEGLLVQGRWLEELAQAVLHLPEDTVLTMMGPDTGKWLKRSAAVLQAPLATGRFFILPPAAHEDLPDFVADADAGVIIYDDRVRNNLFCEPGKLTDYISVGTPVVAPAFPTIGPVVEQYGIGVCFQGHSPQAIAAAMVDVLARPKAKWAPALASAAEALTWQTQVPNLLRAVDGR